MDTIPSHCGSMMPMQGAGLNVKLSAPLERLKLEHVPLREKMEQFYTLAKQIAADRKEDNLNARLVDLHEKAVVFVNELEPHSIREEEGLFPLMAERIGRHMGPIAVMEYEHEQAKKNLKKFMEYISEISLSVELDEATTTVAYLIDAYDILTEHFMKEEVILFPMAERILSDQEKELLYIKFQQM